ncbi:MAG: 1-acyl-sn-glycerol-3-phosphate acyltransferase [Alphaproteobacteria bacterium]|nr:1-acyl-sn-glycerol-3-phosphate acyltransferase [Alphaproteobacteria bacterium]
MTSLVRRPPLDPSPASLATVERIHRWLAPPLSWVLRYWQDLEVVGREHVPASGPALLLANHVTFFDPFTLMVAVGRPVHFMAGEGLFDDPVLGHLARWSGAVPRKKRVADPLSIRRLVKWTRVGGVTGIFPEGERTWDGQGLTLVPGIGRLVASLKAPVVVARLVGGYHQHPRWAAKNRRGPVRVELDPPLHFDRRADPEEVEATLRAALAVDPTVRPAGRLRGRRLAEGLPDALYRCPACDAADRLRARGDQLRCTSCAAAWRLDLEHQLHPDGGGPVLSVPTLLSALRAQGADAFRQAPADGLLWACDDVRLDDITDATSVPLGQGRLELTPSTLRLAGTDFAVSLSDLRVINVFLTRRLQLRTAERSFEATLPDGHAALPFQWLGEPARRAVQPSEAAAAL